MFDYTKRNKCFGRYLGPVIVEKLIWIFASMSEDKLALDI